MDILTIGHIGSNTKSDKANVLLAADTIYASLEAEDIKDVIQQASDYLSTYLNQGNFEGSSGAHGIVVMRLQIVADMLMICHRATSSVTKGLALIDLYKQCQTNDEWL